MSSFIFFIGTYLQDHFWDCKQLESYCAEDPLRSTRWGKYWHIYSSFSTIHQTNLGKYWHIYPSLSPKQQTMLGNVKFWSKYRKLFLGLEEQAEDREVKVYEPQICWTSSLFLYLTILENHSFPFQIVKHNLKMLQTFSQPQHTFKYLVRGKTFCTALTSKSNLCPNFKIKSILYYACRQCQCTGPSWIQEWDFITWSWWVFFGWRFDPRTNVLMFLDRPSG